MFNCIKKHSMFYILLFALVTVVTFTFSACNNAGKASNVKKPTKDAPIAATQEQQDVFRSTFATEIGKDSVWVTSFEKAFSATFGADSLKGFLKRETLPHVAINGNQEINGTERGEYIINAGGILTVNGVVYGRILIMKGAELINRGAIYGNVENAYGIFEDTGFHQGALITR